ncbi:hypothetical protein MMC20_007653 [Loxospora ochrophaea]|nr:hypothetical protein [Loxospora ochrophaea]
MSLFPRTQQPGKALWTIFIIASAPLRIAFLALYYIPPFSRQHPKWTYRQALGKDVFRIWFDYCSAVEHRTSKSLEPGSEKERFVVMEPASTNIYRGILDNPNIRPAKIGGMWYPKLYSPTTNRGKKIAMHFHGGAFVVGGCRPLEGGWGPEVLAKRLSGLAFCPQYRLAVYPNSCFPAALQDGITAYAYLLSLGIPASDIILSGDSAGGNLAIGLVRYLGEHRGVLPEPSAAFLWSPWLNLQVVPGIVDKHRNYQTDYLSDELGYWGVRALTAAGSAVSPDSPYLSPLGNEFATKVPVFVQTGSAEVLTDDHVLFSKAMKDVPENRVELYETANAPHDTFAAAHVLGFVKEAKDAAGAACKFLETTGA